ncbi:MAG: hypothetical protein Q7R79_02145 [bacterium]|nr:hypothetical protein [bacterium]
MHYEVHITVETGDIGKWVDFCGRLGVKPLCIQLSTGEYSNQVMLALSRQCEREEIDAVVASLQSKIRLADYIILRTKLECPLNSGGDNSSVYDECHIKLLLTKEEGEDLEEYCRDLFLFTSTNVLSWKEGCQKWFVTTRSYSGDVIEAREIFQSALTAIQSRFSVLRMDMERVLYDTWPEIDKGWVVTM